VKKEKNRGNKEVRKHREKGIDMREKEKQGERE